MIADHQTRKHANDIMEQYIGKYNKIHNASVEIKYGNICVSFGKLDTFGKKGVEKLKLLFELMDLDYSVCMDTHSQFDISEKDEYCFIVFDGDPKKAEFIRKFTENGYRIIY